MTAEQSPEKRSKWKQKLFPRDKDKPKNEDSLTPAPTGEDSAYGGSEPSSSLTAEGRSNASTSAHASSGTGDRSPRPRADGPSTYTSPTIKQETNPRTGQTVTTTTTTTTTTITVAEPNGATTTIQEPNNNATELPAVSEAAEPQTETQAQQAPLAPDGQPTSRPQRRGSETPGRRLIPPRDPAPAQHTSATDLSPTAPVASSLPSGNEDPNQIYPQSSLTPARNSIPSFSYPGRNRPLGEGSDDTARPDPSRPRSTLQNLKSAAAGIHGAGETLRGTLNSVVDERFSSDPRAHEKNQAALTRGQYEIENRRFLHAQGETQPPRDNTPVRQQQQQSPVVPNYGYSADITGGNAWDEPRTPIGGRLGNLLNKATSRLPSGGVSDADGEPKSRTRLQKRSSSGLGYS
ncbi:hypothetical protein F5Y15DRAFT_126553 [Xylariaceae sp. FL0016]|nr:hypothetical protein F5Y15DRAFT_126553 [Xylariaceae sp. FL0016]